MKILRCSTRLNIHCKNKKDRYFLKINMRSLIFLLASFFLINFAYSSAKIISEEDFGDVWPFTVASGKLECKDPGFIIFSHNGIVYAVNGFARSWAEKRRWHDVERIWKSDKEYPDLKISIGPVIQTGLKLCD